MVRAALTSTASGPSPELLYWIRFRSCLQRLWPVVLATTVSDASKAEWASLRDRGSLDCSPPEKPGSQGLQLARCHPSVSLRPGIASMILRQASLFA